MMETSFFSDTSVASNRPLLQPPENTGTGQPLPSIWTERTNLGLGNSTKSGLVSIVTPEFGAC
jgi:hypothetical protein